MPFVPEDDENMPAVERAQDGPPHTALSPANEAQPNSLIQLPYTSSAEAVGNLTTFCPVPLPLPSTPQATPGMSTTPIALGATATPPTQDSHNHGGAPQVATTQPSGSVGTEAPLGILFNFNTSTNGFQGVQSALFPSGEVLAASHEEIESVFSTSPGLDPNLANLAADTQTTVLLSHPSPSGITVSTPSGDITNIAALPDIPWVSPSAAEAPITGMPPGLNVPSLEEFLSVIEYYTNVFPPGFLSSAYNHIYTMDTSYAKFFRYRPRFTVVGFVDTLEQVDVSTIPAADMRCPHCWLPFGTTDEDDPAFVFTPDPNDSPELAARHIAFRELPFCVAKADNDPVRTPCGHLFGRDCLIESMEKVDTLCPICRLDLRSKPKPLNLMD
jgi:hypothetical protein